MDSKDGGLLVARMLAAQGVRTLFTLCGGHIAPILIGCDAVGIRVIDTRHEVNAVFAADAVARLTGVPGVAAVTAGPGVTNTITAIKNAQMAQSPLVLLGGATATVLKGRGSLQDIDQMALIAPHVKYAATIRRVRDIPAVLAEAFRCALSDVPGPVFVELPIDTLFPEHIIREWYGIKSVGAPDSMPDHASTRRARKMHERLTEWLTQRYLSAHLNRLFGGLDEFESLVAGTPARGIWRTVPLSGAEQAASRLALAQRPVLVIGSQALVQSDRVHEVRQALETLGIPVFCSGMARGLLGASHPLQLRHKRKEALKEADWVLLAGVPSDFRLDYGNHISRRALLLSVNRSEADLKKNRVPDLAFHGDPLEFLIALAAAYQRREDSANAHQRHATFLAALHKRDAARCAEIETQSAQTVYGTGSAASERLLNPLRVCQVLDDVLGEQSVIVADGGDFVATASYIVRPRMPLSWYDPGVFGTLGVGAGFALGIKAVKPEAEVWILYGDGSAGYSIAEFDSFVRHKMGVIAVVGNDACWRQIARDQEPLLGSDIGTRLAYTDYHRVAEGFGGRGVVIRSEDEISPAFLQAQQTAASGVPVLINALIGATEFRKGSISM